MTGGAKEYLNMIKKALRHYEHRLLDSCFGLLIASFLAIGVCAYFYKKSHV